MEDALAELVAALEARPSNALLRAMLAEAEGAVDASVAIDWMEATDASAFSPEMRAMVSAFLRRMEEPNTALPWCDGEDPVLLLERARCLADLGRQADGLEAYRMAVAADPQLEDTGLATQLTPVAQGRSDQGVVVDLLGRNVDTHTLAVPAGRETINFSDVGGLENVKRQIQRRIITPMQKPSLFEKFRRKAGGGVLLYGPPGCGKTLMARATAGEAGARFFQIEISAVLDMYIGESEKRLAAAFETARNHAPSVIFFDEIEALAARRRYGENDNRASLVSTFLTEMDGFSSSNEGVLVLAASNVPWSVDSAFLRPGRFDRSLFVPPPDQTARRAILEMYLKDRPVADNLDIEPIVQRTSGFSGADLSGLIEEACDIAIETSLESNSIEPIAPDHFREALEGLRPSTLDWLSQASNYVRFSNENGFYDDVAEFLNKNTR